MSRKLFFTRSKGAQGVPGNLWCRNRCLSPRDRSLVTNDIGIPKQGRFTCMSRWAQFLAPAPLLPPCIAGITRKARCRVRKQRGRLRGRSTPLDSPGAVPAQRELVMRRGEIWWASLGEPHSSGPSFRRPVLIVQSNEFNESAIRTSICAAMTSNMRLAEAPGNVRVTCRASGLSRESVVKVSLLITLDKQMLTEKVGRLPAESLRDVDAGIKLVLAL